MSLSDSRCLLIFFPFFERERPTDFFTLFEGELPTDSLKLLMRKTEAQTGFKEAHQVDRNDGDLNYMLLYG